MTTMKNAWASAAGLLLAALPAAAQTTGPGTVLTTPTVPMELPIEVEIELSPAGSLKQALLWKEFYQLLENPHEFVCEDPTNPYYCEAGITRRPSFRGAGDGVAMPPVNIYSPGYNFPPASRCACARRTGR
jgi:hypothetical protein